MTSYKSPEEALADMPDGIDYGRNYDTIVAWWANAREQVQSLNSDMANKIDWLIRSTAPPSALGLRNWQPDSAKNSTRKAEKANYFRKRALLHYASWDASFAKCKQGLTGNSEIPKSLSSTSDTENPDVLRTALLLMSNLQLSLTEAEKESQFNKQPAVDELEEIQSPRPHMFDAGKSCRFSSWPTDARHVSWSADEKMIALIRFQALEIVSAQTKNLLFRTGLNLNDSDLGDAMRINLIESPSFARNQSLIAYAIGDTVFLRETEQWRLTSTIRFKAKGDRIEFTQREANLLGNFAQEFADLKHAILAQEQIAIDSLSFAGAQDLLFVANPAWWLLFDLKSFAIIYSEVHEPRNWRKTVISPSGLTIAESILVTNAADCYDFRYHQLIRGASSGTLVLDHPSKLLGIAPKAWSPDSKQVAYQQIHDVIILNVTEGTEYQIGKGYDWRGTHISWSPCGKYLAMYSVSDGLVVIDLTTRLICASYKEQTGKSLSKNCSKGFSWAPASNKICICRKKGKPEIWVPSFGNSD